MSFNQDVLMDILLRLPPKPVVRFLCTCKFWNELICSSIFVTTHLSRNLKKRDNLYLLCLHHPNNQRNVDLDDPFDRQELQWSLFSKETFVQSSKLTHPLGTAAHYGIYGSSNGVLCISDETLNSKSPIHLWNPTVGKCRTLPLSIDTHDIKYHYITLQFGFHLGVNDYRIVRMMMFPDNVFAIEVYSLNANSWKLIEDIPVWLKCPWEHHQGTFFNGVAYHIIAKCHIVTVMSFDTGSEQFLEFILPDAISGSWGLHVDIFREQICLLYEYYCCEEEGKSKNDLWVLEEKGWKQLYPFVFPSSSYHPMGISIDNELVLEKKDFSDGVADLYLCDYETREVRGTGIRLAIMCCARDEALFAITYIQSIGLLNY